MGPLYRRPRDYGPLGKTPNVATQPNSLSCAPDETLATRQTAAALAILLGLSACDMVVLNPAGDVAAQQRDLLVTSTWLMLLIIIPVMALIVIFAWRYRHNNREARYEPDWHHSMRLELIIWSAPLLIVICLGALTWLGTHLLDPYRPLDRISAEKEIPADTRALQVEVVALDWKWLFIYPQYGVATVNEMAVPVNQPLALRITASSVMNAFYAPHLAGHDLRHAGHGDPVARCLERNGRVGRNFRQLQRRRLLGHEVQGAQHERHRVSTLGHDGAGRPAIADPRRLFAVGEAVRARAGAIFRHASTNNSMT